MDTSSLALILSVASLTGVIVGPIITNAIAARQAANERQEARRQRRAEYLAELLKDLIELRSEFELYTANSRRTAAPPDDNIVGRAYSTILASGEDITGEELDTIRLGNAWAIDKYISRIAEQIRKLSDAEA